MNKGQKVLITGAGSGIGLAIAQCFSRNGASVAILDYDKDQIASAMKSHPDLSCYQCDVSDPAMVDEQIGRAIDDLGGIDVLVNNAGIGGPRGAVEDLAVKEWQTCVDVNLSGPFYCSRAALPHLKRQRSGALIHISTASVRTGLPNRSAYIASKGGLNALSANLAREIGPFNLRSNVILPGLINNPRGHRLVELMAQEYGISVAEAEEETIRYISMKTWIDMDEIGNMACFLASDLALHVSGQEIGVCGNAEWDQ